jgi:hypothetical protein
LTSIHVITAPEPTQVFTMNLLRLTCHGALLLGALTGGLGTATAQTKINADPVAVLRQPEVRQRFGPLGIEPTTHSPYEMGKLIANQVANFKKRASAASIHLD